MKYMKRILQKQRSSLFSMIPKEIVVDLNLKQGDELDFSLGSLKGKTVIIAQTTEGMELPEVT